MLLLLRKGVTPADHRALRDEARALSLEVRVLDRASRVVEPVPGPGARKGDVAAVRSRLEDLSFVQSVLVADAPERTAAPFTTVPDLGAVAPLESATHLPVVADPSHAAGRASLVLPLARGGSAAGADGLRVEVHPSPHEALEAFHDPVLAVRPLLDLESKRLPRPAHQLAP